jgi:hypothetical protein
MRILAAGAMIVLLVVPAHSADDDLNPLQKAERQHREDAKEIDRQYERALKNTRSNTPATKADPWGNIRATDPKQGQQSK